MGAETMLIRAILFNDNGKVVDTDLFSSFAEANDWVKEKFNDGKSSHAEFSAVFHFQGSRSSPIID